MQLVLAEFSKKDLQGKEKTKIMWKSKTQKKKKIKRIDNIVLPFLLHKKKKKIKFS